KRKPLLPCTPYLLSMQGNAEDKVIATGTITRGTRISLGHRVLALLGAQVGDFFELYQDRRSGRLYLDKVRAPPQTDAEGCENGSH
nr:hypothetical protein [Candidatus Paceibacterota bacterium]